MAAFSNSLVHFSSGACLKPADRYLGSSAPTSLSFNINHVGKVQYSSSKRALKVQAEYSSDGGKQSNANFFFGGFVLGGLIVGTLGCVYAPQISKALSGADRKDLMRKLPKFIYDEEKALEKTRKILAQKIDQLNSAIDDVSSQLRSDDSPDEADDVANGLAINTDEVEAAI